MNRAIIFCLTISALATWPVSAFAEKYLSGAEVTGLISGKTVSSYHEIKQVDIVEFYDANGQVRGIRNDKKSSGKWRVKENGELCIKRVVKERCRFILNQNGLYEKYKVRQRDEPILIVTFKAFENGNVNGY